MADTKIPEWLVSYIEKNGKEVGPYSFSDNVVLPDLPDEFAGVAEDAYGGGLVVAKKKDGIIYRFQEGEISVYAITKAEFVMALERDARWEELAENMPALLPYWIGIIVKTKTEDGQFLTLGLRGGLHPSALVIRGEVKAGEMLTDTLDRELLEELKIEDYEVVDLIDDGRIVDGNNSEEPLFKVVVEVEKFDSGQITADSRVVWLDEEKEKLTN